MHRDVYATTFRTVDIVNRFRDCYRRKHIKARSGRHLTFHMKEIHQFSTWKRYAKEIHKCWNISAVGILSRAHSSRLVIYVNDRYQQKKVWRPDKKKKSYFNNRAAIVSLIRRGKLNDKFKTSFGKWSLAGKNTYMKFCVPFNFISFSPFPLI